MEGRSSQFDRLIRLMASPVSTSHLANANDAAATVTLEAQPGRAHLIQAISWSYNGAPSGGQLTILDDGREVFSVDITAGGPGYVPVNKRCSPGAEVQVVLAAGGAGVTGRVNVNTTIP